MASHQPTGLRHLAFFYRDKSPETELDEWHLRRQTFWFELSLRVLTVLLFERKMRLAATGCAGV